MLAWAVTIHKSQGKTFDNVIIDIGRGLLRTDRLRGVEPLHVAGRHRTDQAAAEKRHLDGFQGGGVSDQISIQKADKANPVSEKMELLQTLSRINPH